MILTVSSFFFFFQYLPPVLLFFWPLQHAMMLPVLTHHIRYHQCLMHLDKLIGYVFKERCLLQVRHRRDSCLIPE